MGCPAMGGLTTFSSLIDGYSLSVYRIQLPLVCMQRIDSMYLITQYRSNGHPTECTLNKRYATPIHETKFRFHFNPIFCSLILLICDFVNIHQQKQS